MIPLVCSHCGYSTDVRNQSGRCDHLYYPENCHICWNNQKGEAEEMSNSPEYGKVCEHGSLKRKCEICERDQEISQLKSELERLKEMVAHKIKLCGEWHDTCKNLTLELEKTKAVLEELMEVFFEIRFASHLTSSCEHPEGRCPYKIADKALNIISQSLNPISGEEIK